MEQTSRKKFGFHATPRLGVLAEKLIVAESVEKFPAIYESLQFNTVFTEIRN